jgi:hypothetical protein
MDRGLYAQGMSVLQCILRRSLDEIPGYNLEYDFFMHVLDDYMIISHKHCYNVLLRYQSANNMNIPGDYNETLIVLREPLDIWLEFMPEMQLKDKELFSDYYQMYWMLLSMIKIQDKMKVFYKYFPDTMRNCDKCGNLIPKKLSVCHYCSIISSDNNNSFSTVAAPKEEKAKSKKNNFDSVLFIIKVLLLLGLSIFIIFYLYKFFVTGN